MFVPVSVLYVPIKQTLSMGLGCVIVGQVGGNGEPLHFTRSAFHQMKTAKTKVDSRKGKRGASRRGTVKTVDTKVEVIVAGKVTIISQDDIDGVYDTIIVPTCNVDLITGKFNSVALSKLLVDGDDRFNPATVENCKHQFFHCMAEHLIEALEISGDELNDLLSSVKRVHSLNNDYDANKHVYKRGLIITQNLSTAKARKVHSARGAERFTVKV